MLKIRSKLLMAIAGATIVAAPSVSHAQINLGAMMAEAMKPMIEAMMKKNADMTARKLAFDPETKNISKGDTTFSVTIKNTHHDTANFSVKLYSAPPPPLTLPAPKVEEGSIEAATKATTSASKPKRSMVAEDDSTADTTMISYKDLTSWVSFNIKDAKIAPGQSKTFQITVKAPADLAAGLYATWVTAVVSIGPNTFMRVTEGEKAPAKIDQPQFSFQIKGAGDPNQIPEGAQIFSSVKVVLEKK